MAERSAVLRMMIFCVVYLYSHPDHKFFVAKMNMSSIIVLDFFGGAKTVALKDYFKAKPY